ncbi:MAG: cytochrome c1 [Pseudomonadota bacterium]
MRSATTLVRAAAVCLALSAAGVSLAAGGGAALDAANNDVGNTKSLQRGFKYFMNYCSGCHSAEYVRYNTIGAALQISDAELEQNLMFNAQRTFETINISMRSEDATAWLGQVPPDMSLIARSKGVDHIYSFLRGYYRDDKSATGWNNTVVKNVSMPHVLWELEGVKAKAESHSDEAAAQVDGHGASDSPVFDVLAAGSMSADEYDEAVRDIVNFLDFISEPMQLERTQIGVWVMAFLVIFFFLSLFLKKEIWKDVK